MERETFEQLQDRVNAALDVFRNRRLLRHVKSGTLYYMLGISLDSDTLEPMVIYTQYDKRSRKPAVAFTRALTDFRRKFVFLDDLK